MSYSNKKRVFPIDYSVLELPMDSHELIAFDILYGVENLTPFQRESINEVLFSPSLSIEGTILNELIMMKADKRSQKKALKRVMSLLSEKRVTEEEIKKLAKTIYRIEKKSIPLPKNISLEECLKNIYQYNDEINQTKEEIEKFWKAFYEKDIATMTEKILSFQSSRTLVRLPRGFKIAEAEEYYQQLLTSDSDRRMARYPTPKKNEEIFAYLRTLNILKKISNISSL